MSPIDFSTRGADCISESMLDALHLGALDAAETAAARTHLARCELCRARLLTIEEGFDAFPKFDERRALARVRTAVDARKRRRWWMPMLLTGAAAALLFMTMRPSEDGLIGAGEPTIRMKGKAALRIVERTANGSQEVGPEQRLAAGTHIKFKVDLPTAGAVRIVARGGDGVVTLWPQSPSGGLPAGSGQVLPGAVQLDDAPGPEHLFLLHCPNAETVPECPIVGDAPACPAPCTVSPWILLKR